MSGLGRDLVSVIVPAYNAANFIERTIKSIQAQTHANLEILVVDDGSTDGTVGVVRALMLEDTRLRLLTKPNGGVASARNLGLEQARGEYVAFVDADDLFHPAKLEAQVVALKANPDCDAAFVLYVNIDSEDRVLRYQLRHDDRTKVFLPSHLVLQPVGNGSSLLVRREAAIDVGGFDSSYAAAGIGGAEDFDFELRLAARAPMIMVPEYLLGYRLHEGSMSANRPRMSKSMLEVVERCLARSPELPAEVRTMAHRTAYVFAIKNLRIGSHYLALSRTFARYAASDPTGALTTVILDYAARSLKRLVRTISTSASVREPRVEEFFGTVGLKSGICRALNDQDVKRLRQLAIADEQW